MQIKLLPEEERPLEKACQNGIAALSNTELLGLIIHTGTKEHSAIHLAEQVLSCCEAGISELALLCAEDLQKISGIGKNKAYRILASIELGKRMATQKSGYRPRANTSHDVAEMFMESLRYERKEYFKTLMVNAKGEVITVDTVSIGELTSTVVHPREVFVQAVKKSAAGVIFVHNHPSGDPQPSEQDVITTKRLMESGEILGIQVLDHIIIGDGTFASMKALHLMD